MTSGPLIATMHINNPPKRSSLPGYDAEIAMTICLRLLNRESLRSICADPRMPAKATVCRWLARNQEFRRWYALWTAEAIEERKWLRSLVRSFAKTGTTE